MSDLIRKSELYKKLAETYNNRIISWGVNEIVKDIIGECNSVENKGEWKRINPAGIYECTCCGQCVLTSDIDSYKFCHGCGADMRGKT